MVKPNPIVTIMLKMGSSKQEGQMFNQYSWHSLSPGVLFIIAERSLEDNLASDRAARQYELLTPWANALAIDQAATRLHRMEVKGTA